MTTQFILLLLLLCATGSSNSSGNKKYRPVIVVHGILDGSKEMEKLGDFIQQEHPGTNVTLMNLFSYQFSLRPLWKQIEGYMERMEELMREAKDGVHLLCFSQGGLICRALLYMMPNHNVHTFISLSSPQSGQYGITEYVKDILPVSVREDVFYLCYNLVGQLDSICNYWNDPHQRLLYLSGCNFLPRLNGDIPHKDIGVWKENFLRIRKLVLIGGPDDGVITPWQSSIFGFYDKNEQVVEMRKQEFYKNDVFGLRTLDSGGKIWTCIQSGVKHTSWHTNMSVFENCMVPWLT